jgi:hypothetical protein
MKRHIKRGKMSTKLKICITFLTLGAFFSGAANATQTQMYSEQDVKKKCDIFRNVNCLDGKSACVALCSIRLFKTSEDVELCKNACEAGRKACTAAKFDIAKN